ncbi:hypothetical protein FQN54_001270 [Arachnomyces sp. PD_36]|nr:hypothetical protein FQN54_001270 [Arachnomyces sp. PD_36]
MSYTPSNTGDAPQTQPLDSWYQGWEDAPTPGYFTHTPAPSVPDPSPDDVPDPDHLGFVPLNDWDEERSYDEQPPTCIHYLIEWKVTLNNRLVAKDTEPDVVLPPGSYWQLFLKQKPKDIIHRKISRNRQVRLDDTTVVVSVNDRSQRDLTKRFERTDIDWTAVEKQLLMWKNLFRAEIDAERISGQPSAWRDVYKLMRCPGPSCHLGQYCWQDPNGKKHYKLRTHHMKSLVRYVEKGGTLETHDDVPDEIREQLYAEEQQRIEKGQPKGSNPLASNTPYPININLVPSESSNTSILANPTPAMPSHANAHYPDCSKIRGPRDDAVKAYSKWQESNVSDKMLKADVQKACDVALEHGFDLEQIYRRQDPEFFIKNGVKMGIAWRFVTDIAPWAEQQEEILNN